MADDIMTLAGEFPAVTHQDWLAAVDKVLRGSSFQTLRTDLGAGITVEPLYTAADARPVAEVPTTGVSRRASRAAGQTGGWDVRQHHTFTDVDATNAAILLDLQRGVTSIELTTDAISTVEELDAVLRGVLLDLAPVGLTASSAGPNIADLFLQVVAARDVNPTDVQADLGCDPLGALATGSGSDASVDDAVAAAGVLAQRVGREFPRMRTFRADALPYAEAGAGPATELAAVTATALAYVRAMVAAGMAPADAFAQVLLTISVGTDQFGDIAKIRALRRMWRRVMEASEVEPVTATIQAATAAMVATERDPWVNILRGTIGCFSAAVGGADIVTVRPFDALLGVSDDLGRRVARNTQLALLEESNMHRVIDPSGGSWYVEALTDAVAEAAWSQFQGVERGGGVAAAINDGRMRSMVDESWAATADAVATRRRPIIGVSEFPDLDEVSLERSGVASHDVPALPDTGPATLPRRRLAAGFERLRSLAEATDPPPTVFLANLGPISAHTPRAGWAKNFFEAGGIRHVGEAGFEDNDALVAAFRQSGAAIAVICSSDAIYEVKAAGAAATLQRAGAARVYLAGNPGDRREELEAAGVDEFIHVGCNVLESLERAHELLGTDPEDAR